MTKHTKRRRAPNADWRPLAAHLRSNPGIWYDVPEELPTLNPWLVANGDYPVFTPGAFEVRGRARGRQAARYIGDPRDVVAQMTARVDPVDYVRSVDMSTLGYEYGVERCGFTLLPLPRATGDPLVFRESAPPEGVVPTKLPGIEGILTSRGSDWHRVADVLRAHPGEWLPVLDEAMRPGAEVHANLAGLTGYASLIRRGQLVAFRPDGAFEARSRGPYEEGEKRSGFRYLEVRYVGEATS